MYPIDSVLITFFFIFFHSKETYSRAENRERILYREGYMSKRMKFNDILKKKGYVSKRTSFWTHIFLDIYP